MRDFRPRLKQRRPGQAEVMETLRKGQLAKALRKARAAGVVVRQEHIDAAALAMFRAGRTGELLAMVGRVNVKLPYDVNTLLARTFETGDYHTFLKQVHRLGMWATQRDQVDKAISTMEKNAPSEAVAWRKKLGRTIRDGV